MNAAQNTSTKPKEKQKKSLNRQHIPYLCVPHLVSHCIGHRDFPSVKQFLLGTPRRHRLRLRGGRCGRRGSQSGGKRLGELGWGWSDAALEEVSATGRPRYRHRHWHRHREIFGQETHIEARFLWEVTVAPPVIFGTKGRRRGRLRDWSCTGLVDEPVVGQVAFLLQMV